MMIPLMNCLLSFSASFGKFYLHLGGSIWRMDFFWSNIYGLRSKNGRFLRVTYPFVSCLMRIFLGKFMKLVVVFVVSQLVKVSFCKALQSAFGDKDMSQQKGFIHIHKKVG